MENYEKKLKETLVNGNADYEVTRWIEQTFPELKESEESIIKDIRVVLEGSATKFFKEEGKMPIWYDRAIAWLEKQGEHANFRNKIQVGDKVTRNQDGVLVNLSQLKRVAKPAEVQGEQRPVEPQQDMLSQEKYAKAVDECIYGEQKPWSEEDEDVINHLLAICAEAKRYIHLAGCPQDDIVKYQTWLKSLKDRVQPRQEWSEEDGDIRDNIIRDLKRLSGDMVSPNQTYQKEIQWLKSLRPQNTWKPSDEQIKALNDVREILHSEELWNKVNPIMILYESLIRELEQLKKLREE